MNWTRWICYAVGFIFIASGVKKLLDPNFINLFYNLGLPYPSTTLFIVAIVELACGALIVAGLYVRKATIPLLVIMVGAILLTKLPILFTQDVPFIHVIVQFAFDARLDIVATILLLLLYQHVPGKRIR
ncbi:DoxX family protein [Ornithinibacillus halophilus]|nr:DoxX family protein [Ornithinibacillus halophilus]